MLNSKPKVILVVGGSMDYGVPFRKLADKLNLKFTADENILDIAPDRIALAVFTGGEDVDPSLYGKTRHKRTHSNLSRDKFELEVYKKLRANDIPLAGICRGSQFLCVMAGGTLVQDITGHAGRNHMLTVRKADGTFHSVEVNSSHHQMQNPFNLVEDVDYQLVGWVDDPISAHYAFDADTVVPSAGLGHGGVTMEPDIVFYPKIKALAAQYHPEWLDEEHEGFKIYEELVDSYLLPMITNDETRTRAA